ncbi:hypothetical protein PVAP13_1NG206019 [Panicum virgatum]|uniref:Uncharacterized protein n=1 Tax=Panicum virgatum TaxID=38727 RepID=A0A8T0WWP7_PANVG|nr:hypothetical protein PVAP13_1NG206019 [Panicum virgatum]
MSDIAKREFDALVVYGSNYLTWATDVEIKLDSMGLDHTIVQPEAGKDECTKPDKSKDVVFFRHHRSPPKPEPSLKDRLSQQRSIKITDADMIEMTLSTFDPSNIVLQH